MQWEEGDPGRQRAVYGEAGVGQNDSFKEQRLETSVGPVRWRPMTLFNGHNV